MSKGLESFNRVLELGSNYLNIIITSRTNGKKQFVHDVDVVEKELIALDLIRTKIGLYRLVEEFDFTFTNDEYLLLKEVL